MPSLGNKTYPNAGADQTTSLAVTLSLPSDATGHSASAIVGRQLDVDVLVQEVGPGTCTSGFLGDACSDHSYASVASFDLSDVGCDDDQCEVVSITRDAGRADAIVTIVPKSTDITLRAGATSGSLSGDGELWILPAAPPRQEKAFH
jgi:hypothetical protein